MNSLISSYADIKDWVVDEICLIEYGFHYINLSKNQQL